MSTGLLSLAGYGVRFIWYTFPEHCMSTVHLIFYAECKKKKRCHIIYVMRYCRPGWSNVMTFKLPYLILRHLHATNVCQTNFHGMVGKWYDFWTNGLVNCRFVIKNNVQRTGTLAQPSPRCKSVNVFIQFQSASGSLKIINGVRAPTGVIAPGGGGTDYGDCSYRARTTPLG